MFMCCFQIMSIFLYLLAILHFLPYLFIPPVYGKIFLSLLSFLIPIFPVMATVPMFPVMAPISHVPSDGHCPPCSQCWPPSPHVPTDGHHPPCFQWWSPSPRVSRYFHFTLLWITYLVLCHFFSFKLLVLLLNFEIYSCLRVSKGSQFSKCKHSLMPQSKLNSYPSQSRG